MNNLKLTQIVKPETINKWRFTRVNQGIKMTRPDFQTNSIKERNLYWWEKIICWLIYRNYRNK